MPRFHRLVSWDTSLFMFETVRLNLDEEEYRQLALICRQDLRTPGQVLRWLLLKELERRAMLPVEAAKRLHAEEGGSMKENK